MKRNIKENGSIRERGSANFIRRGFHGPEGNFSRKNIKNDNPRRSTGGVSRGESGKCCVGTIVPENFAPLERMESEWRFIEKFRETRLSAREVLSSSRENFSLPNYVSTPFSFPLYSLSIYLSTGEISTVSICPFIPFPMDGATSIDSSSGYAIDPVQLSINLCLLGSPTSRRLKKPSTITSE